MNKTQNFLLIEDDEDDYILAREMMTEAFDKTFQLDWARNWDSGLEALLKQPYDACLIDFQLGAKTGLDLLREAIIRGLSSPVILLTGNGSHKTDLEVMHAGASDYLDKDEITPSLLGRSIRYAIERYKVQKHLETIAKYDQLTGAVNRNLFQLRLTEAIANHQRTGLYLGILMIDIDHFKEINDTYGHPAGDALLKEVSRRLHDVMRETDTVARIGGDEFVVIATNIQTPSGSRAVAQKIARSLSQPYKIEGLDVKASASVGISLSPPDKGTAKELLKNADTALYQAKNELRGSYAFFDSELNNRQLARQKLEFELRQALSNNEFELYYQPKIDSKTGQTIGAEALIRWQHPTRGTVSPVEFIPLVESMGLIHEIGEWVIREACQQLVEWKNQDYGTLTMAVNVSILQLKRPGFVSMVRKIISDVGISPHDLNMEITETMAMEDVEETIAILNRLRKQGITISLDDFGTGHSSLARLKDLPIDTLKIDRSLITNLLDDPRDRGIIKTIIDLAKILNLGIIAEGVETYDQLTCLKDYGCSQIQGYYYSQPVESFEFARRWKEQWVSA